MDLMQYFYIEEDAKSIPIHIVEKSEYSNWKKTQSDTLNNWVQSAQFKAKPSALLKIPDADGKLASVLVIVNPQLIWTLGWCANELPTGNYHIATSCEDKEQLLLGWALGAYRFQRYKKSKKRVTKLKVDESINQNRLQAFLNAVTVVRDMVNTPASDMMPADIAYQCGTIAKESGAVVTEITGDDLLSNNFPVVHAVGRASIHKPCFIEFNWGNKKNPNVCLIGKGVSFDSGGLNIKSGQEMRLMKKDMGGAAHAIGVAHAVMQLNLPIHLKVLVPAVENAISDNAFRPGDVLTSRSGKTIEIDNTDAEGRLILCDAITKAVEEDQDLIIDFATLTGAARVAMGTEVPAFFSNDDSIAEELYLAAKRVHDPIWPLPLHQPYRYMLDSSIADICNSASSGFGGAITAALFLQEFVSVATKWVHFDVMAWNTRSRAGQPKGGEAMGLRAVIEFLEQRYTN